MNSETLIDIDDISSWITKEYKSANDKNKYKREIAIQWNPLTPAASLELVVIEIENGFRSKYNLLSNEIFKKSFCNLNREQLSTVLALFPYRIVLDIGNAPIPPPPPTQIEN